MCDVGVALIREEPALGIQFDIAFFGFCFFSFCRLRPGVSPKLQVRSMFNVAARLLLLYDNAFVVFVGCGRFQKANVAACSAVQAFHEHLSTWHPVEIEGYSPLLTESKFKILDAFVDVTPEGVGDRFGHLNEYGWKLVRTQLSDILWNKLPGLVRRGMLLRAPVPFGGKSRLNVSFAVSLFLFFMQTSITELPTFRRWM